MDASPLFRIDPPGKGRSPAAVAEEIVHLIRSEFRYNTATLCDLFLCDRQWVDKTFRGAVRHVRITHYFSRYILTHTSLSPRERELLSRGFYFYSRTDLQAYWRTHAAAERKTRLIDLADYQKGGFTAELTNEIDFHRAAGPCAKEKQRHDRKMQDLLTPRGYTLYCLSRSGGKTWVPSPLPAWEDTLPLTTLADTREKYGLHSNAAAMQYLLRKGGIRIKLGARALWLVPDGGSLRLPVAVPADADL